MIADEILNFYSNEELLSYCIYHDSRYTNINSRQMYNKMDYSRLTDLSPPMLMAKDLNQFINNEYKFLVVIYDGDKHYAFIFDGCKIASIEKVVSSNINHVTNHSSILMTDDEYKTYKLMNNI